VSHRCPIGVHEIPGLAGLRVSRVSDSMPFDFLNLSGCGALDQRGAVHLLILYNLRLFHFCLFGNLNENDINEYLIQNRNNGPHRPAGNKRVERSGDRRKAVGVLRA